MSFLLIKLMLEKGKYFDYAAKSYPELMLYENLFGKKFKDIHEVEKEISKIGGWIPRTRNLELNELPFSVTEWPVLYSDLYQELEIARIKSVVDF